MLDGDITGFRTVLRDATHDRHDRLDRRISALDLTRKSDFAIFCACHRIAFGALLADPADPALQSNLTALCDALDADLATLGHAALPASDRRRFDPLAIGYILHGSRLGTKVLRKRWHASADPLVRAASKYMSKPADGPAWKATCAALDGIPEGSDRAARLISEAIAIFTLFEGALDDATLLTTSDPPKQVG